MYVCSCDWVLFISQCDHICCWQSFLFLCTFFTCIKIWKSTRWSVPECWSVKSWHILRQCKQDFGLHRIIPFSKLCCCAIPFSMVFICVNEIFQVPFLLLLLLIAFIYAILCSQVDSLHSSRAILNECLFCSAFLNICWSSFYLQWCLVVMWAFFVCWAARWWEVVCAAFSHMALAFAIMHL